MSATKTSDKTIKVEQVGSPIRRRHDQRETLVGLGLNKVGRVAELADTPATRGMIGKWRTSCGWSGSDGPRSSSPGEQSPQRLRGLTRQSIQRIDLVRE